jgi:hypothetical protein
MPLSAGLYDLIALGCSRPWLVTIVYYRLYIYYVSIVYTTILMSDIRKATTCVDEYPGDLSGPRPLCWVTDIVFKPRV